LSEACDAWLAYVAGEKDRRPSTVKDYRNTVRRYLVPEFGADTLLHTIDTERVDAIRERMLAEAQLSRRTIQKILVLLHGIHKRAKRKGWIATAGAQRPMSDPVARVLDALSRRKEGTRPDDLVFSPGFNVPFYDDTVRKRFYVALEAAGLGRLRTKNDPIVFHDLRHTFGTLAVQAFPLSDVKAMMGHADISTTMVYVHHVPQTDAAARLSAVLEPGHDKERADVV
jgi:site-specific recombinase XerD